MIEGKDAIDYYLYDIAIVCTDVFDNTGAYNTKKCFMITDNSDGKYSSLKIEGKDAMSLTQVAYVFIDFMF